MALPPDITRFVCRDDGVDTNGGGFIEGGSGTDYSNQAAAHVSFNGTTITATTAAASATIVITGYTVAATDIDNLLQVTGGVNFITGATAFFRVLSVNVGLNTWTLDRNVTTGAGSGMTGAMGGSLLTIQKAFAALPASCQVYAKGSFSNTAAILLPSLTNNQTFPARLTGFSTAIGDGGRATLTTATNSIHLVDLNGQTGWQFSNLRATSSAGTPGDGFRAVSGGTNAVAISFINSRIDHVSIGINGNFAVDWGINGLTLVSCEIDHCVSNGYQNSFGAKEIDCYIHENGGHGFSYSGGSQGGRSFDAVASTHWKNTGNGVDNSAQAGVGTAVGRSISMQNCDIVDNAKGVNILGGGGTNSEQSLTLVNCIIYGNTTGVDTSTATMVVAVDRFNAYKNTTDVSGWTKGTGDVALTGDPFNGRTSNDFSLNNTAGAGAACKGVGTPGATDFGTGHIDIGALQSAGGGGGGGLLVHPGMQGGMRG
jgi:hypothetical protein